MVLVLCGSVESIGVLHQFVAVGDPADASVCFAKKNDPADCLYRSRYGLHDDLIVADSFAALGQVADRRLDEILIIREGDDLSEFCVADHHHTVYMFLYLHLSDSLGCQQGENKQCPGVSPNGDLLPIITDCITVDVPPLTRRDFQLSLGDAPKTEGLIVGEEQSLRVARDDKVAGGSRNAHNLGQLRPINSTVYAYRIISEVGYYKPFALRYLCSPRRRHPSYDDRDILMYQIQNLQILISDYECVSHPLSQMNLLYAYLYPNAALHQC